VPEIGNAAFKPKVKAWTFEAKAIAAEPRP